MPDLSRYLIKTSMAYLVAALGFGIALTEPVLSRYPLLPAVYPSYIHLFVVGWLSQLIFGVAFWLFPRVSRERPYGATWVPWTGFVLINAGLLLRLISEPAHAWAPRAVWAVLLSISSILQWLAGICFVVYFWSRVKGK